MRVLTLIWLLSTVLDVPATTAVGTVYACTPVFIRTAPALDAPVVVLDDTYAVVVPHETVQYTQVSPHWVHLTSQLGFLPAAALDDTVCFHDTLPTAMTCLQQYAQDVPNANPDAAFIVAAYFYYSAHYRVDPLFVLAQAFHESNVLRSWWATQHHNYAGLWVSGAIRTAPPTSGYWVPVETGAGTTWYAGRSFATPTQGVATHVERVAAYASEQAVLSRWAADPQYARKIRAWQQHLTTVCPYDYAF